MAGFPHWLRILPEEADEAFCDAIYPALRMGDGDAKRLVVRRYMRLAFALCKRHASSYPDTDELVAEALYALVECVERIADGALDRHIPKPNIGAYVNVCVYGALNVLRRRYPMLNVIPKEYRFEQSPLQILIEKEQDNKLWEALTPRQRAVLEHRMDGLRDREIGELLSLSQSTVYNTRAEIKKILEQML